MYKAISLCLLDEHQSIFSLLFHQTIIQNRISLLRVTSLHTERIKCNVQSHWCKTRSFRTLKFAITQLDDKRENEYNNAFADILNLFRLTNSPLFYLYLCLENREIWKSTKKIKLMHLFNFLINHRVLWWKKKLSLSSLPFIYLQNESNIHFFFS